MGDTLHIVPHTHWDREWYEPFEVFRLRLVDTVDRLLDILDDEPGYRFHLDGQTAAIDDYLEVRPERAVDIGRFARDGRLDLGPWTTLPDELLVSGETLVRNLTGGIRRAGTFGGLVRIGYLPDSFGHTAQMPQILRLCGLERALVWRGVPSDIDRTVFTWHALDGSAVRTGYLCFSYSNAAALPVDPEPLRERASALVAEQRAFAPAGHVLAMNGTDHWLPQQGLVAAIDAADRIAGTPGGETGGGPALRLGSITGWFEAIEAALGDTPLPHVSGELRSGARSNVLMGVTSTRTDLKRLRSRAERTLERLVEPLSVVTGWTPPQRLLDTAWRNLILNAAHDSVCACSSDPTMADVEGRDRRSLEISLGLLDRGLAGLASGILDSRLVRAGDDADRDGARFPDLLRGPGSGDLPDPAELMPHGLVLWNPAGVFRSAVCEITLPTGGITGEVGLETPAGDRIPCLARDRVETVVADWVWQRESIPDLVEIVRERRLRGLCLNTVFVSDPVTDGDGTETVDVVLGLAGTLHGHVDADFVEARLTALAAEGDRTFRVRAIRRPETRLQFRTPPLPPLGWTTLLPVAGDGVRDQGPAPVGHGPAEARAAPVRTEGLAIDNGILRVSADPVTGTFAIEGRDGEGVVASGLAGLEDTGDAGDTYNYSPPPGDRPVTDPARVEVGIVDATTLSATLRSTRLLDLPAALEDGELGRTTETRSLEIVTEVTIEAGSRIAALDVELDNTVRDHRLRLVLPLPGRTRGSRAGVAFGAVDRGLETEGSDQEAPLPTWPAHDFVRCETPDGGLTVLVDQVVEYEVVGDGMAIALTLLRATGRLARPAPRLRPNPAGPDVPVKHAQSLGPQRFRCGLVLDRRPPGDAASASLAEEFALSVHTVVKPPTPTVPSRVRLAPAASPLRCEGEPPIRITALTRQKDGVDLRFVNYGDTEASVFPELGTAVLEANGLEAEPFVVDLLGDPIAGGDPVTPETPLRPFEIRTLRWRRGGVGSDPAGTDPLR